MGKLLLDGRFFRAFLLLFSRFFGPRGDTGVFFLEFLHSAFSIQQFLLAGKKGMAGRADVYPDTFPGRSDLIGRPAGAGGGSLKILGMNFGFH